MDSCKIILLDFLLLTLLFPLSHFEAIDKTFTGMQNKGGEDISQTKKQMDFLSSNSQQTPDGSDQKKSVQFEGSYLRAVMQSAIPAAHAHLKTWVPKDYDSDILSREVVSELGFHTRKSVDPRFGIFRNEEGLWISHANDESLGSFLERCAPSKSSFAWVSAEHHGRSALLRAYYKSKGAVPASPASLAAAWRREPKKSTSSLKCILRAGGLGCGKWMVFVPSDDVDAVWASIVSALWDGHLGPSAKVIGPFKAIVYS